MAFFFIPSIGIECWEHNGAFALILSGTFPSFILHHEFLENMVTGFMMILGFYFGSLMPCKTGQK